MRVVYGQYLVMDDEICHGALTFKGTRILASVVLEQIAHGESFASIQESWGGKINQVAIMEAIHLASLLLAKQKKELIQELADELVG